MCGLVGIAGQMEFKDEAILKKLLLADFIRGSDSTGVAAISKQNVTKIAKIASHPIDLFDTKRFSMINAATSSAIIGHNRAATKGAVNTVNAHPFEYDHIVGVHNGTLEGTAWYDLKQMIDVDTDVDSQAVFASFAKNGIEKTIEVLEGAWAFVWWDRSDKTLNFLRNDKRPFYYGVSEDRKKLFWASEHPMISYACNTGSSEVKFDKPDGSHVYFATQVDMWYSIPQADLGFGGKIKPLEEYIVCEMKPKVKEVVKKVVSPFPTGTQHRVGNGGTTPSRTFTAGGHGSTAHSTKKDVIDLDGTADKPFGGYIDQATFQKIAEYGCDFCGKELNFWESQGSIIWEKTNRILGPCCSGTKHVSKVYTESLLA